MEGRLGFRIHYYPNVQHNRSYAWHGFSNLLETSKIILLLLYISICQIYVFIYAAALIFIIILI